MTRYYETMSDNTKSFDWTALPPGQYRMQRCELVPVDEEKAAYEAAADRFVSALQRLTT